jgi:hypothetical protein
VFTSYLVRHPEYTDDAPGVLAVAAFIEAWPCKNRPQPTRKSYQF